MAENDPSNRRLELALALFCVCGVGVTILSPQFVPVGIAICLGSAAVTAWLYAGDLMRIPFWVLRHRRQMEKVPRDTWLAAWLALAVICLGIGAPGYLYLSHAPPGQPVPPTIAKPSVLLLWENKQLRLYNEGDADIYIWGDKFDDDPAHLESVSRTIPGKSTLSGQTGFYYFLPDLLENQAKTVIGGNGQNLVPFEVYLKDGAQKKYIAKFDLLIVMKDSVMTIHTQQLGVTDNGW